MRPLGIFLFLVLLLLPANAQLAELSINPFNTRLAGRPLGMGGAFAGLADDVNAAFYNPAGLAWVKGVAFCLQDSENLTVSQAYPNGYWSSFGLSLIKARDSNVPISSGVANSNSTVVFLSYGTKLSLWPTLYRNEFLKRVGVGVNIKGLLGETLRRTGQLARSGIGWDVDLGLLYKGSDWWTVGLSLQNALPARMFGAGLVRWDIGGEEGIPATLKLGASARVIGDIETPIFMEGRELLLTSDVDYSNRYSPVIRLGGELGFNKSVFFRTGYMQQHKPEGVTLDINYGFGLRLEEWGLDLAGYREPIRDQRCLSFSFLYFPTDWIVAKKLEIAKPRLMVEEPFERISLEDNLFTYNDRLEVLGKVKPGVDVYINGLPAALEEDNAFKTLIPLRPGKNLIVVEARYEAERKVWKYKVLRKTPVKVIGGEKEKVETLATMGVIDVTPEADFALQVGVTRGELASWLVRATGLLLPVVATAPCVDVAASDPLAPYIKVVVDVGLLTLFPDGTFRPAELMTKAEGDALFLKLEARE